MGILEASHRLALFTVLLVGIGIAAFAWQLTDNSPLAEATHGATEGRVDFISIDVDPFATPANTANSIGSREECRSVGVDEFIEFDITADEVHPADDLAGWQVDLIFDPALAEVIDVVAIGSNTLMGSDGSALIYFSTALTMDGPDEDTIPEGQDGSIQIAVADFGTTDANEGSGILARVMLYTLGAGSLPLSMTNPVLSDGGAHALAAGDLLGGEFAIGQACPAEIVKADVRVAGVQVDAPASVANGDPFQVTATATLNSNGPFGPVNADAVVALTVPPDCQATPGAQSVEDISLEVSVATILDPLSWTVDCDEPSFHDFSASATLTLDDPAAIDPVAGNNSAQGQATTAVTAESDIELTGVNLNAPAESTSGTMFKIFASADLVNNGPYGPAGVLLSLTLSMPADCEAPAQNVQKLVQGSVLTGPGATIPTPDASWNVVCDQAGSHAFSVNGSVAVSQQHVSDPASGNNTGQAQASTNILVGICGDDPDPSGNVLQNPSPLLLQLIINLTDDGTSAVPEGQEFQLECTFDLNLDDNKGAPIDDCEVSTLLEVIPCSVTLDVAIDQPGGSPIGQPGVRLNPIGIMFVPAEFDFAPDLDIVNGSPAGASDFNIRTDGGLGVNGVPCIIDAFFPVTPGFEGATQGNAPDSNDNDDLTNPHVWPNDLNGEVATIQAALHVNPLAPPPVTLWSRVVIPFNVSGLGLAMNILVFHVDDLTIQEATGAEWLMIGLPGDAINPDPPGPIGGDPDADDGVSGDTTYCTPYSTAFTLNGTAGGATFAECTVAAEPMAWSLVDPDATNWTMDQGPRSDTSPCSLDLDSDGLSANEETYFGTDPLNADSDADGFQDGSDNCPSTANPGQEDYDGDGIGDICDPDVDGDNVANGADACPLTAVGAETGPDGCSQAQVDADADGVCNPGAPGGGPEPCTGTDLCSGTALGATVGPEGCSQAQVDADADGACDPGAPGGGPQPCTGIDNCPTDANPGQEDDDGDGFGDVCDFCPTTFNTWAVPPGDDDCDAYPTDDELIIGTDIFDGCPETPDVDDEADDKWPADFNDNQLIDILDVLALKPVFGETTESVSPRFDIRVDTRIDILDVLALKPVFNQSCV